MEKMNAFLSKWIVPVLMAVAFPGLFYWEIADYESHSEGLTLLMLVLGVAVLAVCALGLRWAVRGHSWGMALLYVLAAVSCVFFCYWMDRIPFCAVCEPMRKSDLGFMLEPFADRFGDVCVK